MTYETRAFHDNPKRFRVEFFTAETVTTVQQQTDFAIIPDRQSIATVERDIRFFPSTTDCPETLTAAEIETWNRDGYLGPLDVYDGDSDR